MTKPPAFQMYAKDALDAKVVRMSDAAQGVYWRLIFHIWAHTKTQYSIQNLDKKLAKMLGLSNYKWKRYRAEIQANGDPLFVEQDGMLISKRLMEEREKQVVRKKQTQEAARIRWEKERMQTHMRTHNQTDMQTACPSSSTAIATANSKSKPLAENNRFFTVLQTDHDRYQKTYLISEEELRREYGAMVIWLDANPKKRPKKNYKRFVTGWIARNYRQRKAVHDAGQIVKAAAVKAKVEPKAEKAPRRSHPKKTREEQLAELAKWRRENE